MPPLVLLAAALASVHPVSAPEPDAVTIPDQPELTPQIAARDAEFFQLSFTGRCEFERFRSMLADDIEFYHDRGGFNARRPEDSSPSPAPPAPSATIPAPGARGASWCRKAFMSMRVPGWGAIETGEHLSYEREGVDGEERLAGRAQLWVLGPAGPWRLSRVFSYAHGPAAEAAAAGPAPR